MRKSTTARCMSAVGLTAILAACGAAGAQPVVVPAAPLASSAVAQHSAPPPSAPRPTTPTAGTSTSTPHKKTPILGHPAPTHTPAHATAPTKPAITPAPSGGGDDDSDNFGGPSDGDGNI